MLGPIISKDPQLEPPYSTAREYSSLTVLSLNQYANASRNTLWFLKLQKANPDEDLDGKYHLISGLIDVLEGTNLDFVPHSGSLPVGPPNCDISSSGVVFVGKNSGPPVLGVWSSQTYWIPSANLRDGISRNPRLIKSPGFSGKSSFPKFSPDGRSVAFLRGLSATDYISENHILIAKDVTDHPAAVEVPAYDRDSPDEPWSLIPEAFSWNNNGTTLYVLATHIG